MRFSSTTTTAAATLMLLLPAAHPVIANPIAIAEAAPSTPELPIPANLESEEEEEYGGGEQQIETAVLLAKRKLCTLVKGPPGGGGIPCRSGAGPAYSVVAYLSVSFSVDVYCKANGSPYQGLKVWDWIDRKSGTDCWISAYHTMSGCEGSGVRWC